VIALLRSAFFGCVGAQGALVLARAAGDGGHGPGCVGLQGLGARVVDERDLAGAQAADQVLVADRAYNWHSAPGAATLARRTKLHVCQEGGQARQDVVLADVGVLRPETVLAISANSATQPIVVHRIHRSASAVMTGSQLGIHRRARIGFSVHSLLANKPPSMIISVHLREQTSASC